jgi:hypothetical protein
MRLRTFLAIPVLALFCLPARSAELTSKLTPIAAMHRTPYGSLFFIQDVVNDYDIRQDTTFVFINGDGDLDLPQQNGGFCFAFNHYTTTDWSRLSKTYRARIRKTYAAGNTKTERFAREYIPTPILTSEALPTLCINGIANAGQIQIDFSSEGGRVFTRTVSFKVN